VHNEDIARGGKALPLFQRHHKVSFRATADKSFRARASARPGMTALFDGCYRLRADTMCHQPKSVDLSITSSVRSSVPVHPAL
jgi:hypothetical protein